MPLEVGRVPREAALGARPAGTPSVCVHTAVIMLDARDKRDDAEHQRQRPQVEAA
jgi:hypothetical protein